MKPNYADNFSLYTSSGGRKYLNAAERRGALAVMVTLRPEQALFALTLAWTGARVSEVLALRALSFQIDRGIVALHTLKRRRFVVREVPIPPELMGALDRYFGIAGAQRDEVCADRRLWPWHRTTGWRIIKKVMTLAGIVGRAACPRGLRHAFGIGSLQSGIPPNLIQRWLGHARLSTTSIYADASGPEEAAFASKFWYPADVERDRLIAPQSTAVKCPKRRRP